MGRKEEREREEERRRGEEEDRREREKREKKALTMQVSFLTLTPQTMGLCAAAISSPNFLPCSHDVSPPFGTCRRGTYLTLTLA